MTISFSIQNGARKRLSTGPTTAGKAVFRFNALKRGAYAVHQIISTKKPRISPSSPPNTTEHYSPAGRLEKKHLPKSHNCNRLVYMSMY
jgi:hypothetical protein